LLINNGNAEVMVWVLRLLINVSSYLPQGCGVRLATEYAPTPLLGGTRPRWCIVLYAPGQSEQEVWVSPGGRVTDARRALIKLLLDKVTPAAL